MMKTKVTKLYDVALIPTPEDIPEWRVDEAAVDGLVKALAVQHAVETQGDAVQTGDTVFCAARGALEDRTVLVYPGRSIPGAEQAEKALLGAGCGDTVKTELAGSPVSLTVQRIVRRTPAPIDDRLVREEKIDGVETVAAYRAYIKEKTQEQNRSLSAKHLSAALHDALVEKSDYQVDEEEQEAWTDKAAKEMLKMYEQEGIDPHIPEDGTDFLTDEEVLAQFKESLRSQYLSLAMSRAFCEQQGVTFGPEEQKLYAENGCTGDEAESGFMESKTWEILYNIAMERLEGTK